MTNFKGVVEPVLVLLLCVGLVRGEGSGGFDSEDEGLLVDMEGLDDGEGSGEFDYLSPIEEKAGPSLDLARTQLGPGPGLVRTVPAWPRPDPGLGPVK